ILLRQKQKKLIMLPSETMIWQPEFTDKTLSRKPGAVQLSLPQNNKGAFEIPDSIVDTEYNGNGEEVYRVNWQDIRPEHILMILCCYATVYHNVASADYVEQMTGTVEKEQKTGILASFLSIIGHEKVKAGTSQPKSLTGKEVDEDTVIL
ncbi:hypothetical protein Q5479_23730, partial [Escherichia coli]|nr:hypothetical protein [Escherichia coli]